MLGTYLAIIDGKVYQNQSTGKENWTHITNSTFEINGNKWIIQYDNITIQFERGLYTITNGITKLFSHNGLLWVE